MTAIAHPAFVGALGWVGGLRPDTTKIGILGRDAQQIVVLDATARTTEATTVLDTAPLAAVVDASGKLVVLCADASIRRFAWPALTVVDVLAATCNPDRPVIIATATDVLIHGPARGQLQRFVAGSATPVGELRVPMVDIRMGHLAMESGGFSTVWLLDGAGKIGVLTATPLGFVWGGTTQFQIVDPFAVSAVVGGVGPGGFTYLTADRRAHGASVHVDIDADGFPVDPPPTTDRTLADDTYLSLLALDPTGYDYGTDTNAGLFAETLINWWYPVTDLPPQGPGAVGCAVQNGPGLAWLTDSVTPPCADCGTYDSGSPFPLAFTDSLSNPGCNPQSDFISSFVIDDAEPTCCYHITAHQGSFYCGPGDGGTNFWGRNHLNIYPVTAAGVLRSGSCDGPIVYSFGNPSIGVQSVFLEQTCDPAPCTPNDIDLDLYLCGASGQVNIDIDNASDAGQANLGTADHALDITTQDCIDCTCPYPTPDYVGVVSGQCNGVSCGGCVTPPNTNLPYSDSQAPGICNATIGDPGADIHNVEYLLNPVQDPTGCITITYLLQVVNTGIPACSGNPQVATEVAFSGPGLPAGGVFAGSACAGSRVPLVANIDVSNGTSSVSDTISLCASDLNHSGLKLTLRAYSVDSVPGSTCIGMASDYDVTWDIAVDAVPCGCSSLVP